MATKAVFFCTHRILGQLITLLPHVSIRNLPIHSSYLNSLSLSGIIMSGNEISQILLSLFLSYAGGQRNRPLWIAWGVAICGISCFILALPHFIYGAGEDALRLTKEYQDQFTRDTSFTITVRNVIWQ